jgi:broad specificity phosphatase PhoE
MITQSSMSCIIRQGLLKHEGKERFGEAYKQWQKDAANFTIDGHYPVRELWARAKNCWTKILSHNGQSILVVAHNAVNQALVATAIGNWQSNYYFLSSFFAQKDTKGTS